MRRDQYFHILLKTYDQSKPMHNDFMATIEIINLIKTIATELT
jgi:hypothetical protein